jgi:hypothetical protein
MKMATTTKCFAVMNGLPVYNGRAKVSNVIVNDIITYRVKGKWIFSVVTGTTPSSIKVIDLSCEITDDSVRFYCKNVKNRTTDNAVVDSRRIFKVGNITYL